MHAGSVPSQSVPLEYPLSECSNYRLIRGKLKAPQGSGSTLNIIISLADTRGRLFSSRSFPLVVVISGLPFVWIISQPFTWEMAAIHPGYPGMASRSLPCLLLHKSLLRFPYFKSLFSLRGLLFVTFMLPLTPLLCLAAKTTKKLLKPFGCILCDCLWVPALWGWSRGWRVTFELTGRDAAGPLWSVAAIEAELTMNDWLQHGNDSTADTG